MVQGTRVLTLPRNGTLCRNSFHPAMQVLNAAARTRQAKAKATIARLSLTSATNRRP